MSLRAPVAPGRSNPGAHGKFSEIASSCHPAYGGAGLLAMTPVAVKQKGLLAHLSFRPMFRLTFSCVTRSYR